MKLYGSLTSPFVRAARIAAIELGLDVDLVPTVVKPAAPNRDFGASINPLRRVPALEGDDGAIIIDSRVIVEYLNDKGSGALIPADAKARIDCLNRHAVVSGATEALVSAMYENKVRPADKCWAEWSYDQIDKAHAALDWSEARAGEFSGPFDLAAIGLVCLLDYAAFRFPQIDWLGARPGLRAFRKDASARTSVAETTPRD